MQFDVHPCGHIEVYSLWDTFLVKNYVSITCLARCNIKRSS